MSFDYEPPSAAQMLRDQGVPEDVADGILCCYAHELAEKIRRWNNNWEDPAVSVAIDESADLIGPEAQSTEQGHPDCRECGSDGSCCKHCGHWRSPTP